MKTSFSLVSTTAFALLLCTSGCGDDKAADGGGDTGTETATDGGTDEVGESGTATTTSTSTSTSTDTSTDTNATTSTTDGSCPIGAEGCPCTDGGGCDPGLSCEGGTCGMAGTTDPTTTDTTDTTDSTTGVDPMPYQACPNGDGDCLANEVCITGTANQGQLDWTMCTSGTCNGDADCAVDDNDVCNDLPGDGEPVDYCVPMVCDQNNPCDAPLECAFGFGGGNAGGACVWPN